MGLLAVGNGLLFAYIPVKLAVEGFQPWVAGAMITVMAAGGLAGCLFTGRLVGRVGHARVFATLAALVILSVLIIALGAEPVLWIASRGLYGFAMSGLFIVSQSWLNDACEDDWRGRVIAAFYMTYVLAIGTGGFLLRYVSLEGPQVPLFGIFFVTVAILPVGLTRLRTPPPPEAVSVAIASVWRISPVGLVGLLTVGGLSMLVQGFAPIYAAAEGYAKDDIALLLFLMQFGMIAVQYPLGALSDRTDRRYVLIAAALMVIASAALATQLNGTALLWLVLVFAVWSGATESIYAVANAHANDRADPRYYVSLSSTLLIAWSLSGLVLPGLATVLTQVVGPEAFMYVAIAAAALYAAFVAYRLTRREPAPEADQEPYQPISAQVPHTAELAPQPADAEPS
jgi:MFS family permease